MRHFIIALLAATTLGVSAASAADLPSRNYTKAVPYAPVYNWTGFYVGIHGGYGWGDLDAGAFGSTSQRGGLVGGQIGYNWQPVGSPWMFGVEVDSAWANIEESASFTSGGVTATASSNVNYLGSARGRVGYAWDHALLYATGGVGWAHNVVSANATFGGFTAGASVDNTHFGYTVGGGLEYAVAGPWTVKAEYLYYGLGDESYVGVNADLKIHTVKLGLNYRF